MMDEQTPDSLRPGDLVGPWRIEGYAGRGTYGVVYRARRAGHPGSVPVALKLALFSNDPRALREMGLLRRTRHPAIPELVDRGWWHSNTGQIHLYLAMQWVNGAPLYEWARVHNPTSRQVLQVVAQAAWALEVLHRARCLHRDVKGDNILVEPEGRAFLTDFGSGTWAGAAPITDSLMPPGTREYRGPEAIRFQWQHLRQRGVHYEARTFDDLYALGVSAYRLVTGIYPPPGTDPEARLEPVWIPPPLRKPAHELNPRVVPELSALIERMLAAEPEARGLAREVAEAAEAAAEHAGPEAHVPLMAPRQTPVANAVPVRVEPAAQQAAVEKAPVEAVAVPVHTDSNAEARMPWRGLAAIALVLLVTVSIWWMGHGPYATTPRVTQAQEPDEEESRDGGPASLGDASVTVRVSSQGPPISPESVALDMPDQPLPGQQHAPCRGRKDVEINGGCWGLAKEEPPCGDSSYEWNGACYFPVLARTRPPTSKKPQ